ncbi:MAG: hypothetical protein KAS63_10140 [Candidatus Heimdallarchaeota archaeon]|nr:hypothetical protein [Candidatus Heimdallarchaeota archaeon]MCK4955712.1 hypothetical protein [Candidatus Heimdallarchaeota archaeon]
MKEERNWTAFIIVLITTCAIIFVLIFLGIKGIVNIYAVIGITSMIIIVFAIIAFASWRRPKIPRG